MRVVAEPNPARYQSAASSFGVDGRHPRTKAQARLRFVTFCSTNVC